MKKNQFESFIVLALIIVILVVAGRSAFSAFWYPLGNQTNNDPFRSGVYLPASADEGEGEGEGPPPPSVITSFTGVPNPILRGQSTTLSWSSTNTTFCSGACISGDCAEWLVPDPKPTSGSQNVTPGTTSTYRLSCIGPGGSAQRELTITVRTIRWREVIPRLFPFLNRVLGMGE